MNLRIDGPMDVFLSLIAMGLIVFIILRFNRLQKSGRLWSGENKHLDNGGEDKLNRD